jgi:hypothetical protein
MEAKMAKRKCALCGTILSQYNPGLICQSCQKKIAEQRANVVEGLNYDLEDMSIILGLGSQEQVRQLAQAKKLPPNIPVVRQWLWPRAVVDDWIKGGYQLTPELKEQLQALVDAHGGVHDDETTGERKVGERVDIQVQVYSKDKGGEIVHETRKVSNVIPGHHQSRRK